MDEETRVVVQHLTDGDHMRGKGDAASVLPLSSQLPDGLQTVEIEGETFRILVKTTRLGERISPLRPPSTACWSAWAHRCRFNDVSWPMPRMNFARP